MWKEAIVCVDQSIICRKVSSSYPVYPTCNMIHISANWEYGTMSTVDLIDEDDNESDIAAKAARVLQEYFIAAAKSETVLYVENDNLVSKTPNAVPIVIKRLCGRNPELVQRLAGRGTFKIKKRKVSQD
jgi:hypothetical protein